MQQFAHHPHPHHAAQLSAEYDHHHRFARRRLSMAEPYPDPHSHPLSHHHNTGAMGGAPHSLPASSSYLHAAMQNQHQHAQMSPFGQPASPYGGGDSRYATSPADEPHAFRYPEPLPPLSMPAHEEDMYYRPSPAQTPSSLVGPGWATPARTRRCWPACSG